MDGGINGFNNCMHGDYYALYSDFAPFVFSSLPHSSLIFRLFSERLRVK